MRTRIKSIIIGGDNEGIYHSSATDARESDAMILPLTIELKK
jgi:hypothetical protein